MSKEKETEKIISDKLNSREFAFDEKAWAGMEGLLDAQQKKRRFGFFWYFSASMFVVLVAGAAWFLNSQQDFKGDDVDQTNNTVSNQNNTVLGQNNTALSKNNTVSGQNNTALSKNNTVLGQNNTALSQNNTVLGQNNIVSSQNNTVSEQNNTFSAEMAADSAKTAQEVLLIDTASLAETAKNPLTAPGKETKNAWGVLAGAGYWFAYKTTLGTTTDTRFGFTGGVYYQRILSKRWEIGLSAVYSSRGALDFAKTFVNTNYGFGIQSDKTTVAPKTLHYLNVPLTIRFNVTQRSHFYIGAAYYQLLATTSKVTRVIENSFGEVLLSSSEKQTGEHKGFRKNDIAAFIGYEFTLFDHMNADFQINYGFYDITKNGYKYEYDYPNEKQFDRNISLKLQLKYDLIRH